MNMEEAFKVWFKPYGHLWADVSIDDCLDAFEAGWNAAIAQPEVERSTPIVSTTAAEDIYAAYPRKVGKQAAIKIIKRLTFHNVSAAWLLERAQAYAKATESWPEEDRKYIPHPATWFNRGSYDDDPKEWVRGTAPTSQFSQSH
jgi:hypothetical protein